MVAPLTLTVTDDRNAKNPYEASDGHLGNLNTR